MSWLTSRMARVGLSSEKSRNGTPASIISSTSAAVPTLSMVVVSHMLESPTMTCNRRYFSASACGSVRVWVSGRVRGGGGGRGDALPDVLGTLGKAERGGLGGLQHLAGPADQLASDQERQQHVGNP